MMQDRNGQILNIQADIIRNGALSETAKDAAGNIIIPGAKLGGDDSRTPDARTKKTVRFKN